MSALLFISIFVLQLGETSPATPDAAIQPAASVRLLKATFENCSFTATQKSVADPPSGHGFVTSADVVGWICAEGRLLRLLNRTELYPPDVATGTGKPFQESKFAAEKRWTPANSLLQTELTLRGPQDWPLSGNLSDAIRINAILSYPSIEVDSAAFWNANVMGEFLGGIDLSSGISFDDVVTAGGSRNFELQKSFWNSSDHSSATFVYESTEYGTSTVTLQQIDGRWMPTRLKLVREAEDRVVIPTPDFDGKLKNYLAYTDFSGTPTGLDRLETTYDIQYAPLPKSIKKTERRFVGAETSTITTELTFRRFSAGGVTLATIASHLLSIPSGTEVVPTDSERKPLHWVYEDGEVVNSISPDGERFGAGAAFVSKRRLGLIVTSIIVAALSIAVLYARVRGV